MAKLIHYVVIAACLVVVVSFAGFVADQLRYGSETQQAKLSDELNDPDLGVAGERKREREHSAVREKIDDADDILLTPFAGIVDSHNVWVQRGIPTLLALLAYGLIAALIANSLPKPKAHGGDWRAAGT